MAAPDRIEIGVHFEMDVPGQDSPFRSALYFSEREWKNTSNGELSRLKKERLAAHLAGLAAAEERFEFSQRPEELARQAQEAEAAATLDLIEQGLAAQKAIIEQQAQQFEVERHAEAIEAGLVEPRPEFVLPPPEE